MPQTPVKILKRFTSLVKIIRDRSAILLSAEFYNEHAATEKSLMLCTTSDNAVSWNTKNVKKS